MPGQTKAVETRWMEIVVAGLFIAIGLIVIKDSFRTGLGWTAEGPRPGYFPFHIALILMGGGLYVMVQTLWRWSRQKDISTFATYGQIGLVLRLLIPTTIYVAMLFFVGLYGASVLFIATFMVWQGRYGIARSALVAMAVLLVVMICFEVIFQVALPKNPADEWMVSELSGLYAGLKAMF